MAQGPVHRQVSGIRHCTTYLTRVIVDLVATGSTLNANGLVETEVIAKVTSRLIVNRTALKTRPEAVGAMIARFRDALAAIS